MSELERWMGKNVLASLALALAVAGVALLAAQWLPDQVFVVRALSISAFAAIAAGLPRGLVAHSQGTRDAQVAWRVIVLAVYELALFTLGVFSFDAPYRGEIVCVCLGVVLLAVRFASVRPGVEVCYAALRINELVVLFAGAWSCAVLGDDVISRSLMAIYAVLACGIIALRASEAIANVPAGRARNGALAVFTALAFVATVMGYLVGCTNFAAEAYVASAWCLGVALVVLAFGFAARLRAVRVCGLVLVVACVAKLVLADFSALDVNVRVVAFLVAAALCLVGSLLYTRASRRVAEDVPAESANLPQKEWYGAPSENLAPTPAAVFQPDPVNPRMQPPVPPTV